MEKTEKIIRTAIFSSVGYLCAGIAVSLFAGINLWSQFLENDETVFSLAVVLTFILSAIAGIVLIRYLVPKIGAKTVYEQDILVAMIGMLFIALAINIAMLFVGIIICSGALAVFFYENFTRQLNFVKELNHSKFNQSKQSNSKVFYLSGWALGPIIAVLAISIFSNLIGVLTLRILFAHFIVISFWLWIQRLGVHEAFEDAPTALLAHLQEDASANGKTTADITNKDTSTDKAHIQDGNKSQDATAKDNKDTSLDSNETVKVSSCNPSDKIAQTESNVTDKSQNN